MKEFEIERIQNCINVLERIYKLLDSLGMRNDVSIKVHKRFLPILSQIISIQCSLETDVERFQEQLKK